MSDERIRFRKIHRYKYQLMDSYAHQTNITGQSGEVTDGWVVMNDDGLLMVKRGYAWNGLSGPTIDTNNSMRGSLVHDALYQLMREGILSRDQRSAADDLLRQICIADGMASLRAGWIYLAVRSCGREHARRRPPEPHEYAPSVDH